MVAATEAFDILERPLASIPSSCLHWLAHVYDIELLAKEVAGAPHHVM